MKRNRKILVFVGITILSVGLILWLILGNVYCSTFWNISLKDWIGIILSISLGIVGIIIAYKLNEKSANKRMFFNAYNEKIVSLINVMQNCKTCIINDSTKKTFDSTILSYNKNLNNSIELLLKYSRKMNAMKEMEFVKKQLTEFKKITTENIILLKQDKYKEKAILKLDLMIGKLDELHLKQYNDLLINDAK